MVFRLIGTLTVACAAGTTLFQEQKKEGAQTAHPSVEFVRPVQRKVTDYRDFAGRVEASQAAALRAQVGGEVLKVAFRPNSAVKKGELLFELDARLYEVELKKAKAEAQRWAARAKLATMQLDRLKKLPGGVSREEFERAQADKAEADALVDSARASVELAELRLSHTKVKAPFSGVIGKPAVTAGSVADRGDALATIVVADPVMVTFEVDQRTALALLPAKRPPGKAANTADCPCEVRATGDPARLHKGQVDFAHLSFGPSGTASREVLLANPDGGLLLGMSVRVRIPVGEPYKALAIPAESPWKGNGNQVLVVNDRDVIELRTVTWGETEGGYTVVKRGLTNKDRVLPAIPGSLRLAGKFVGVRVTPVEAKPQRRGP